MYCSSCGSAIPQNLTYCNHCGARVGALTGLAKSTELSPNFLLTVIAWVFVLGLGGIVGLMAIAKEGLGINPVIVAAAMLCFALLLGVETVLIYLLLKGRKRTGEADVTRLAKAHTTSELGEHAKALPEALPSVTEHTTRTFDPIFSDDKSN